MTVAGVIMYERGYNKYQVQGRADMKLKTLGNDAGTLYGVSAYIVLSCNYIY
jgi:hypothetical protein